MRNHQTYLKALTPLGALFAVATLTGQSRPLCHSTPVRPPENACVVPMDCEGLQHPMCQGEWQCVQGECRYQCETPKGCHSDADCPKGQHCSVSDGDCRTDPACPMCDVCYGECVPDRAKCVQSGCSGEVCAAEPVFTPCVWQEWFECLKLTTCGNFGPDGACGFEPNQEFLDCLAKVKTCKADKDCPSGLVCVNGACDRPKPEPKACWTDADCAWYEYCQFPIYLEGRKDEAIPGGGIACCPPNAFCIPEIPPCGEGECVLRPGYCWSDADCDVGERCEGAIPPCPPGTLCFAAEQPGKCVADKPPCRPVKPGSHGACEMVLGFIFDGTGCVLESGCSCEPDCGAFFKTLEDCQAACLGPLPCTDDADCPEGQVCIWSGGCPPCDCDPAAGTDCVCPMCMPPAHGFCRPMICASDKDCNDGAECTEVCDGIDNDCDGLVDEDGCGATCKSDQDCATYEYCDHSPWADMPGCCVPLDPSGEGCPADYPVCPGQCRLRPGYCWSDADCQKGEACEGAIICPPGAYCLLPDQPGKCVKKSYIPCTSDASCPKGQVCDTSQCLSCCPDAPPDMPCIALCCGQCVPASTLCQSDADCPVGQYCALKMDSAGNVTGSCAPVPKGACVRDADCGEGGFCQFGPCPLCFPCPCFGTCVYQKGCQAHADCPPGQECKTYCGNGWCEGTCQALPEGLCWSDKDCPAGSYCNVLKCGNSKCPGPYQCIKGEPKCIQTGCSGEVCSTESVITPCWYLPWFECLKYTQCGNFGPGGSCAFEQTPEFVKCLAKYGL